MINLKKNNIKDKIFQHAPMIILFISVLNEIDFNNLGIKYFSFNFSYILIFYFSLKKNTNFGYGLIFIAGLFNDAVVGTPIGLSSFIYLLLCGAAAYLRNIILRPSLIKNWLFFLITILIANSISFLILTFIFLYEINLFDQGINIICTFLLYLFFAYIFNFFEKVVFGIRYVS